MTRTALRVVAVTIAALASTTTAASAQDAFFADAAPDMSHVVFASAERLTADDTDAAADLYARTATGLRRISTGPAGGNGTFPVNIGDVRGVSADGSRVTFLTTESLTSDDVDSAVDLYQRAGDTTTRLSQGPLGGNSPAGFTVVALPSDDGTAVAFETNETLAAGDVSAIDIYVRRGDQTTLLTPAIGVHAVRAVASDGSRVILESTAQLSIADQDAGLDVYEWTPTGTTLLSVSDSLGEAFADVGFAGASRDASRVFMATEAKLLTSGPQLDTDLVTDVYERSGGTTKRVSTSSLGGNLPVPATFAGTSADGTRVFFHTEETMELTDVDPSQDVWERRDGVSTHQRSGGTTTVAATFRGASADGARVFFTTIEALAGTTDGAEDVFVHDDQGIQVVSTGPAGGNAETAAFFLGNSADGSRAFFTTTEKLTGDDTDNRNDIYERAGATTTRVTTGPNGGNGDKDAFTTPAGVSTDGSSVVFHTGEALTPNDGDGLFDVYERRGGTTRLLSGEGIPPVASITGGPAQGDTIADKTPEFAFAADEESTFVCSADDDAAAPCTSPHTTAELDDGEHTFRVVATDRFGNEGAAVERTFRVDTTAPDTTITSGPEGATNAAVAQFGFEASEPGAKFQCRVDGAAFADCSSPFTTAALSQGAHTFEVRATDTAGNTDDSPASRGLVIDTTPPDTTITAGPAAGASISDATPTFAFAADEAGSTFQCSIDGTAFVACGSPHTTIPLGNGSHTFQVRARDAAGNLEDTPALRSFTVQVGGGTGPGAARLVITSRSLRLDRKRKIAVALRCDGPTTSRCQGTLRIRTRSRVRTSRGRRVVTLATIRFNLRGDSRKTVKLSPSRANRTLIQRLRRVSVTVTATPTGQRAVSKWLTLRGN